MNERRLVIDLDGTICTQMDSETYGLATPKWDVICQVNKCYVAGWYILIFTARGMNTCQGDICLIEDRYRKMTEDWLKKHVVMYHELKFGKPPGTMYVDDKCVDLEKFSKGDCFARGH